MSDVKHVKFPPKTLADALVRLESLREHTVTLNKGRTQLAQQLAAAKKRIDELEAWQRLRDGSGRTAADIYRDLKEEVAYHKGKRKDAEAAQVAMYKELEELRQRAMHKFPPMPKAPWEESDEPA